MDRVLKNTKNLLTRYFIGIIFQVLSISIFVSIGLSILGIENAIIIGVAAGIANTIPYLGPLIGAILALILLFTTNADLNFYEELLPLSGKVLIVFAIVQLMDNFI
ncbi:MAG: AI-2E family transporter [Flavobacteriales bacterium]